MITIENITYFVLGASVTIIYSKLRRRYRAYKYRGGKIKFRI